MNAGGDVADVQDWLRHRDIASMIYAAVTNKRREAKCEEALLSDEIAANNTVTSVDERKRILAGKAAE